MFLQRISTTERPLVSTNETTQSHHLLTLNSILSLLDILSYTHMHMHTNIQYMTCYMSIYKYILYNYGPPYLGISGQSVKSHIQYIILDILVLA